MTDKETIFNPVKNALIGLFSGFSNGKLNGEQVNSERAEKLIYSLITLYSQADDFLLKVRQQDELFEEYNEFAELKEYSFDLLMINFFATDNRYMDEEFMESDEWQKIEAKTIERGTEFLNILLYVYEAMEADAEVDIDDFLNEFLLADDELYQDEYFIYEPVIVYQDLVDAGIEDIIEVQQKITNDEIKDIFIPLIIFFNKDSNLDKVTKSLNKKLKNSALAVGLLSALFAFQQGTSIVPKTLANSN